jgi:hypothetical protein
MFPGNPQTKATVANRGRQSRFIRHVIADHDRSAALESGHGQQGL